MIRAVLGLSLPALPIAGSINRSVDEKAMKEIAGACGLVGAKLIPEGGRRTILLDGRYNDEMKGWCAVQEIQKRKLAGSVHTDFTKVPPPTPEQRKCLEELIREQGLAGLDHSDRCGVK